MKKTFVAVVLYMALLSSFTVSASAEFSSSDSTTLSNVYTQLTAIRNELGYPGGNYSSLRRAVNYIADHMPGASPDYSTVLSNIKSNSDSLVSYIKLIEGDTNSITARCTELVNLVNTVNSSIGTAQISITNHIDSASSQNHSDLTSFSAQNHSDFSLLYTGFFSVLNDTLGDVDGLPFKSPISYVRSLGHMWFDIEYDGISGWSSERTLYSRLKQLQEVLASDDDLQLKKDNKANEDAATDAFVNGNSSKTSLGTGDIGNLKDVGGSFNDLTSLNGQSSVTSFLNGLTSADGTGQGWFSEATRASLDSVTPPPMNKVRAFDVYRGERSSTYVILPDVSLLSPDMYAEPVDVAFSASSDDPYNMSGFEDNYNWLWGDAS